MDSNSILEWFRTPEGKLALAGAAGGAVRWATLREKPVQGMASLFVGLVCSVYLGPVAVPIVDLLFARVLLDPDQRALPAGFIVGMLGIAFTGFIIDIWGAYRKKRVAEEASTGQAKP